MILCCGEALIDMIPQETVEGPHGFVPHAGGAVFNTARALGRMGANVGMYTGLSHDMFGDILKAALQESQVDISTAVFSNHPSTLAFVQLTEGHARYSFFDENSAGRMLETDELPPVPLAADALFFGGISLVAEPAADTYATLLERESGQKLIILDPNVRPSFIKDEGKYRARLERMIAQSDIVKVSDEDLNWLYPGDDELSSKVAMIMEAGAKMVLLTQGADGATACSTSLGDVSVKAETVDVVDTVGAGDAFNAGFLTELQRQGFANAARFPELTRDALVQSLQLAMKVAAFTVTHSGANPPWQHQL